MTSSHSEKKKKDKKKTKQKAELKTSLKVKIFSNTNHGKTQKITINLRTFIFLIINISENERGLLSIQSGIPVCLSFCQPNEKQQIR